MVRALHRAGIEVILDIVFNHTAEGDETGPTLCFRGWDNSIYYMLDDDRRRYRNYTGCGNTLNCNHPIVRTLIIDCLRYWVVEMHVDGFRFDLGSVLGRDRRGRLMENPPILERIAEDPVLRQTKIIAEAWDAAGAYQVGPFPGGRWAEWNDRFRDDVRRFWRGDAGMVGAPGHPHLRQLRPVPADGRKALPASTSSPRHDGFTLNDLVSYARKHNEENGEDGPGRVRAELQRQPRRRGPQRRPGDRGGPRAPGEELPRHAPAVPGHADAPRRATRCAARSGATTTPGARTTRRAGTTGRCWSGTPTSTASPGTCSRFVVPTPYCGRGPSTATRTSSGSIPPDGARSGSTAVRSAWRA